MKASRRGLFGWLSGAAVAAATPPVELPAVAKEDPAKAAQDVLIAKLQEKVAALEYSSAMPPQRYVTGSYAIHSTSTWMPPWEEK